MSLLSLIVCILLLASSYAYKTSKGIQLNITKSLVVLDFTEDFSILCSTSDKITDDGYKTIYKIEIEKSSQNEATHDIEQQIVSSIDNTNGTRGAIYSNGTLTVEGSIKEVTNSYLVMTFAVATSFALGNYSCNVHGYSNEVSAQPLLRSSNDWRIIQKTETDIDAVSQLIVEEKKANNLLAEYWPSDNFSLLKPATGCPPDTRGGGWRQPSIKIYTKNWAGNMDKIPNGFPEQPAQDKEASIVLYFCSLQGKGHYPWPAGDYCIHKNRPENTCSEGFVEGTLAFGINSLQVSKDLLKRSPPGKISTLDDGNTLVNVSFCCRNDSNVSKAINLPTHAPFYLYQHKSKACQAVTSMDVTADFIYINTSGQNVDEEVGELPRHRINGVRPWLCLYTSQRAPLDEIREFINTPFVKKREDNKRGEEETADQPTPP